MASIFARVAGLFRGRDGKSIGAIGKFVDLRGGNEAKTGTRITAHTALEATAVLACCRAIADGLAQVPFRVYRKTANGSEVASDHPVNGLLHRAPNEWQTAYEFRETLAFHVLLTGDAFVFKNMVGRKRTLTELILLDPGKVEVLRDGYVLSYRVTGDDGRQQVFPADVIWHVRGPSWDTFKGMQAVRLAREAVGLALATEATHALFHKNAARPSGIYTVEGTINPEAMEKLSAWITAHVSGPSQHKPLVLDRKASWQSVTMTGVDAQHLETRRFQIEEICRAFRVMPIMVGYSDKAATYASAEQMFLAHVVHTLSPWYARLEQSADAALLTDEERAEGLFTSFTPAALMRGTTKERYEAYQIGLGNLNSPGWMTVDEVRALEDLPKLGGDAAELMRPAAADPASTAPSAPQNPPENG